MLREISAQDIVRATEDWAPLVDAAGTALVALAAGSGHAPLRSSLPLLDGQLLTMPGHLENADTAIVKMVSIVPENARRDKSTIQGVAILIDARTGEPLALLDGVTLTAVRTGAVSAAAARALADPGARTMALLGSGGQARWQARALISTLPIEQLSIWSPTPDNRERLTRELADELAVEVRAASDPADATRDASIVCCATTARNAFLQRDMLTRDRVLVIAIGAFRPDMAEVGVSVFESAGSVFVDDAAAVQHEGGDVMAALERGVLPRDSVVPVGSVLSREHSAPDDGVTVFKSVGSALEDAAVAGAILENR